MKKQNNANESDFNENEIPDLNSLKPFEFQSKRNIRDIKSSSSDKEEGVESNTDKEQRVMRAQYKSSSWQMLFKIGIRAATLLIKDSTTGVFL